MSSLLYLPSDAPISGTFLRTPTNAGSVALCRLVQFFLMAWLSASSWIGSDMIVTLALIAVKPGRCRVFVVRVARLHVVRRGGAADPQADLDRVVAKLPLAVRIPRTDFLQRADEARCAGELVECQEPQGVAHDDTDAGAQDAGRTH